MAIPKEIQQKIAVNLAKWKKDAEVQSWPLSEKYRVVRVEDRNSAYQNARKRQQQGIIGKLFSSDLATKFNYYVIDYSEELGSGGGGTVIGAYKINDETSQSKIAIAQEKSFVAKITKATDEAAAAEANNEVNRGNKNLWIEGPAPIEDKFCIIMERLPGKTFDPYDSEFQDLSFAARVKGLFDFIIALQNDHCGSNPQFHGDIKPSNFLIEFNNNTISSFRLGDYGVGTKLSGDPNKLRDLDSGSFGTPQFMAPEAFTGHYSAKTDMWGFAIIAIYFFGGDPIIGLRRSPTPLKFDNLFTGIKVPKFACDVKPIITEFLRMAGDIEHDMRANTELAVTFITALNKLCQEYKQDPKDIAAQYNYLAKLILISKGWWKQDLGKKQTGKLDKTVTKHKGNSTTQKTWSANDFSDNEKLGEAVVLLYKKNLLDETTSKLLGSEPHAAQAILLLQKKKLLNADILFELVALPEKCEWLVRATKFETGYALLLSTQAGSNYISNLKPKDQLAILGDLLKNYNNYTNIVGLDEVNRLHSILIKSLLKDIKSYSENKAKLNAEEYGRFGLGYKNGVKKEAADNLIKVYSGDLAGASFFSDKHKLDRKALNEPWIFSTLRKRSGALVDYVEKNQELFTPPEPRK